MTVRTAEVLVTGAGGWLGSSLVARLRQGQKLAVQALTRADVDLSDEHQTREVLSAVRPRVVVHLAASLKRESDSESVTAQWRDTFWAGRNMLQAAVAAGVRHLVLAGTMEELGDRGGVVAPDVTGEPRTTYGLCKALVREVACFEARHAPVRVDWFRPTTVYGPGQRGKMLVPYACSSASSGQKAWFTDGAQRRDFLFVDDLLEWLCLVVREEVGEFGERGVHLHHLGTGVGVAVRDVLELISGELPSADFELSALPSNAHEPTLQVVPSYRDSNPTLNQWKPKIGWEEGITRTAAWWRSQAL